MFGIDPRVVRTVWSAAVVVLALYCIYTIRTTVLVMVFAVFFSYVVYPLVALAQRHLGGKLPDSAILALVFALVLGLAAMAASWLGSPIAAQAASLGQELPRLLEPGTLAARLPVPGFLEPFRGRLAALLSRLLQGGQAQALPVAREIGAGLVHAAGNLVYVVVVPIFSFLMIRQVPAFEELLLSLARGEHGALWIKVVRDLNFLLSRYVRALALLSLVALAVYSAVLTLLGVPFALLLAAVAALLEVIPVFGPLAAAVALIGVAAFNGYVHLWWLVGFVVAYRVVQDYALNPYLMSEGMHLPPILVVFGLLAGDELAGVAGIFLSIPALAALRIVLSRARSDELLRRGRPPAS